MISRAANLYPTDPQMAAALQGMINAQNHLLNDVSQHYTKAEVVEIMEGSDTPGVAPRFRIKYTSPQRPSAMIFFIVRVHEDHLEWMGMPGRFSMGNFVAVPQSHAENTRKAIGEFLGRI